jgi:hypothetical protein
MDRALPDKTNVAKAAKAGAQKARTATKGKKKTRKGK